MGTPGFGKKRLQLGGVTLLERQGAGDEHHAIVEPVLDIELLIVADVKYEGMIIHHDDAEREFAYDRESSIGKLVRGLDEAAQRGWLLVSMKNDWKQIFGQSSNGR